MLDTARLLTSQPLPPGRRVAIVGNAGGSLAIAADACVEAGLRLAELPAATQRRAVAPGQPRRRAAGRGRSRADGRRRRRRRRRSRPWSPDPGVDCVLAALRPVARRVPPTEVAAGARGRPARPPRRDGRRAASTARSPAVAAPAPVPAVRRRRCGGARPRPGRRLRGVAARNPRASRRVLDAPVDDAARRAGAGPPGGDGPGPARRAGARWPSLDAIGLATLPHRGGRSTSTTRWRRRTSIGYPVVLKAAGRAAMAKTAAAGFAIDLEGPDALSPGLGAHGGDRSATGCVPALVQPMVAPGVDVRVAVRDHPSVGPVLSLGPGGRGRGARHRGRHRGCCRSPTSTPTRLVAADPPGPLARRRRPAERWKPLLLRVAALVEEVPEIVRARRSTRSSSPTARAVDHPGPRPRVARRSSATPGRRCGGL